MPESVRRRGSSDGNGPAFGDSPAVNHWIAESIFVSGDITNGLAYDAEADSVQYVNLMYQVMSDRPRVISRAKSEVLAGFGKVEHSSIAGKLLVIVNHQSSPNNSDTECIAWLDTSRCNT